MNLSATINNISITKNIVNSLGAYAIVLQGNILTQVNTNIYIVVPFDIGNLNNNTLNSLAIEQLIESANDQLINTSPNGAVNTILGKSVSLNNLIENNVRYRYAINPSFNNGTNYGNNFVIYKTNVGKISNMYNIFFERFFKQPSNTIKSSVIFFENTISPVLQNETTTSEIMIDCSPVEITTKGDNVMFSTRDPIFGTNISDDKSGEIIKWIFILFMTCISIFLIVRLLYWWKSTYLDKSVPPKSK